ncbi:hypothetical protein [Siminovitchia sp. 179-K 8D1 HS]|uniref:hypothetical protein n=1 Tax=Siminovitchia sp. 179-K 8D1 HS TaxID=3142385 RepID=UPI0039A2D25A
MKIEKVNEKYYNDDKLHRITLAISNAINPTFDVWATCEQYALDVLAEYFLENGYVGLYHDYNEEEREDFYCTENGLYFDLSRIYIEEEIHNG